MHLSVEILRKLDDCWKDFLNGRLIDDLKVEIPCPTNILSTKDESISIGLPIIQRIANG
jgi:hypothetical protein